MSVKEKWINIGIAIAVPKNKTKELEKLLAPYADELGWKISSGNQSGQTEHHPANSLKIEPQQSEEPQAQFRDEPGEKSQISIAPESGRISPEELKQKLNKIAGVGFGILKDVVYLGDREKALQNYMQGFIITSAILPKTKKEVYFLGHTIGFLWFNYEVSKRVALEQADKEFALSLFFNTTAEDELRDFFAKKKPEENDAEIKSKLEELYSFKLD